MSGQRNIQIFNGFVYLSRFLNNQLLDAACQLVLALGRDEGVFAGHFQIAVARDLGGFNGAAANLFPLSDICSAERV